MIRYSKPTHFDARKYYNNTITSNLFLTILDIYFFSLEGYLERYAKLVRKRKEKDQYTYCLSRLAQLIC